MYSNEMASSKIKRKSNVNTMEIVLLLLINIGFSQALEAPRIVEHPIDTLVQKMEPATLRCNAVGSPTPDISWYKDGERLKGDLPHRMMLPGGELFFLKVTNSRRESDAGVYWCVATNDFGSARSNNASLTVAVLKDEFRVSPRPDTVVALGETAVLECVPPKGVPDPQVLWRKNGHIMDLTNTKRIRIVDNGNLAIQDCRASDVGRYQCVAKNVVGTRESAMAYLKVHVKPFMIRGPQNQTAVTGTSVIFPCRVGGDPLPDVLWRRSSAGGNMPLGRVHVLEDRSLRLDQIELDDAGEYTCEADNDVGTVISSGVLTVHSSPTFTVHPRSQVVEIGSEALYECQATGHPHPLVFWTLEGNQTLLLPDTRHDNIEITRTADGGTIFSISNIQRSDNGKILVCSAVNSVGSVSTRAIITLKLQDDRPPPLILEGPSNQTLPIKSVTTMPCRVAGDPKPVVTWYKDGIPVLPSDKINISEGFLTITNLEKDIDAGFYTCVASSKTGKSTWSAHLKLEAPTNPNIKFFRAPEHSALPGAPGKPNIIAVTETSVTFQWARSTKVGSSSLIGYSIEMFAKNITDGWTVMAKKVQNTTYTQTGLITEQAYYFVVRAENAHGLSAPSVASDQVVLKPNTSLMSINMSEARASLLSGEAVELVNVTSIDSSSVRFYWEITNGKYVEGIYIYALDLEASKEPFYQTTTILNTGNSKTCTLNDLKKYRTYEFFVIPFYKSVHGKPSNSRTMKTMEDVPSMPISNMEALLLNSSAVYLKWKPPPIESYNGILKTYHIIVRGLNTRMNYSKILTNVTIEADSPSLLLANLTEGITYTVSVAAATNAGLGPFSAPSVLSIDPVTKTLDKTHRFQINHDHMDDFLTQPWFICLLGLILAILMLSFGAMVFVKRKHMIMKQAALTTIRDPPGSRMLKFDNTVRADGIWIDASSDLWCAKNKNSSSNGNNITIPDYAPVCTQDTLPAEQRKRIEYSEYAEISAPSSNVSYHNASPYATSSILMNNDINAFQHHHQSNMYLNSDVESYYNGRSGGGSSSGGGSTYRDKLTITENKLASTHNLVPGTTTRLMMFNTLDGSGSGGVGVGDGNENGYQHRQMRHPDQQMYMKVGDPASWNRNHQTRLKDPDIIYAPSAAMNRNVISFLNKKDFRDDV